MSTNTIILVHIGLIDPFCFTSKKNKGSTSWLFQSGCQRSAILIISKTWDYLNFAIKKLQSWEKKMHIGFCNFQTLSNACSKHTWKKKKIKKIYSCFIFSFPTKLSHIYCLTPKNSRGPTLVFNKRGCPNPSFIFKENIYYPLWYQKDIRELTMKVSFYLTMIKTIFNINGCCR